MKVCGSELKPATSLEVPAVPALTVPAGITTSTSESNAGAGTVDKAGSFTLFRRAKLWFDAIPPAVIDSALDLGLLVGRLGLTDRNGNPLCAAVRPPLIEWSAAAAD